MDKLKLVVGGVIMLPVLAATGPVAAFVGGVLATNLAYNTGTTVVRNLRELKDEEDGECYYVYYSLKNVFGVADMFIPEFFDTDIISSAKNIKMKHCVAWFTTSATTYVTVEITSGRTDGVNA